MKIVKIVFLMSFFFFGLFFAFSSVKAAFFIPCVQTGSNGSCITPPLPNCTENSWQCSNWSFCYDIGTAYRTCQLKPACTNPTPKPIEQQPCTPTCKSFDYSNWSECQPNGKKTRTVISTTPSNCSGGSPKIEDSCEYQACTEKDITCTEWSVCLPAGVQSRNCYKNSQCMGDIKFPENIQACRFNATTSTPIIEDDKQVSDNPLPEVLKACTEDNIACTEWTSCMSNNFQYRDCHKNGECDGLLNFPETTKACQYVKPVEKTKAIPVVKVVAKPKIIKQYAVLNGIYNIREKGDIKSKIIGLTSKNTKYEILDSSNKDWVKIKFGNKTGWVFRKNIKNI